MTRPGRHTHPKVKLEPQGWDSMDTIGVLMVVLMIVGPLALANLDTIGRFVFG